MKTKIQSTSLLLLFLLTLQIGKSQNRITVNIPSAESETAYIWSTIQDTKFFEENNYQVSLPGGTLIDDLKQKAKTRSLTDADYELLRKYVLDSVYDPADYQKGFEKIKAQLNLLNQMVQQLNELDLNWSFKEFENYTVNLTLYGPGGSFNPDEGSILVYTTPKGQFKSYVNPANTIIHEVVHIGIQESIVVKYNVPHRLKERIVDTFVSMLFLSSLPDYTIQDMGEYRIDPYLKKRDDLTKLDQIVEQLLEDNK